MARFGLIGIQYSDDSGNPLVDGLLDFFQSGSSDESDRITTYSDPGQKIPNANPVPLSAAGRQPNIFFDGAARVVLRTAAGVQIEVRDPVPSLASSGTAFAAWNALVTYDEDQIVIGSDGNYYLSITPNNLNHNPISTTGFWQRFGFINGYSSAQTYGTNDIVLASDDNLYLSLVDNNLNNDPLVSPSQWKVLTSSGAVTGPISSTDNAIVRFGGAGGNLLQNSGILIDDSDNISGIANLNLTGAISLGDNQNINIGAGNDLQLYHDGTGSFISDQGTGSLKILTSDLRVQNASDTQPSLVAVPGSSVILYFSGGIKLSTTTTGVTVTGNLIASGASAAALLDEVSSSTNPTLIPNRADGDTGIGWNATGAVSIIGDGSERMRFTPSGILSFLNMFANNAAGPGFMNESASQTNPTLVPNKTNTNTGVGWSSADALALIAGGQRRLGLTTTDIIAYGNLRADNAAGPAMLNEAVSSINPTLVPNRSDDNTGVGWVSADILNVITGAGERMRFLNQTTTGINMGAQVKHTDGVLYAVGTQEMPLVELDATGSFNTSVRIGKLMHKDSGTPTFTVDQQAGIQIGAMWMITNEAGGNITLAQGSGVTIRWFDGAAGAVSTGNRTLGTGGILTLYKYTNTEYHVWGSGIS